MRKITLLITAIIFAFATTGCMSTGYRHSNAVSLGAVGGLAGSLLHEDKGKGAAIGGIIGYAVGNEYDKARMGYHSPPPQQGYYQQPQQQPQQPVYYNNPGVESAYHKGRSDYYKKQQREAERRARDIGRAGW